MTGREWKPGDVGITAGDPWCDPQRFVVQQGPKELRFVYGDGSTLLHPPREDARPLVVIDAEDREQVERLLSLFADSLNWGPHNMQRESYREPLQAALREFADPNPPRPEEPTGLGAVVELVGGGVLVRTPAPIDDLAVWADMHGDFYPWSALDVAKVLNEGWSE